MAVTGAREAEVEEPLLELSSQLILSEVLFQIEFDVVAEPKALISIDLKGLVQVYGSFKASAEAVGASEAKLTHLKQKHLNFSPKSSSKEKS